MILMAVESSCDETAVALVEDGRRILTDCIASQVDLHRIYGGVVPEIASRKHIEAIYGLADQALATAGLGRKDVDGIAVTYAPGLIGAVLVGVNFAKGAALALDVPLIPVRHIRGHIAANYLAYPELEPPFLCLVVSGGHTMLVHVQDYTRMEILGTTLDDAAGECFDKVARILDMPYPGGAALDRKAREGTEGRYPLPRARAGENPLDMSFSEPQNRRHQPDSQRRAEGRAPGGGGPLRGLLRRRVRYAGAPGHGGAPPHRLWEAGCRLEALPPTPASAGTFWQRRNRWAPRFTCRPWPSAATMPP
ncbi:MAG: tRNA (adenosine(37)-N6)-threonylcarbamoyltransferase complex transferase subunit TsaD [Oscillospiraceae bacterium]